MTSWLVLDGIQERRGAGEGASGSSRREGERGGVWRGAGGGELLEAG